MIAVKPVPRQHQPGHEGPCQEQWKLWVSASTKNIGRHCWGIKTLSQSGLDVFLVFLAEPSVTAAVSGVVLLRRCESQADFLLAVSSLWWVLRLISIHPQSLRSSMRGLLSFSHSLHPCFKLPVSFLVVRLWAFNYAVVVSIHHYKIIYIMFWILHLLTLLMQISHLHHCTSFYHFYFVTQCSQPSS